MFGLAPLSTVVWLPIVAGVIVLLTGSDRNAPLARWWPEFGNEGKSPITLRQVLSHQGRLLALPHEQQVAAALTHHRHAGRLLDCHGRPQPRAIVSAMTSVSFGRLVC